MYEYERATMKLARAIIYILVWELPKALLYKLPKTILTKARKHK